MACVFLQLFMIQYVACTNKSIFYCQYFAVCNIWLSLKIYPTTYYGHGQSTDPTEQSLFNFFKCECLLLIAECCWFLPWPPADIRTDRVCEWCSPRVPDSNQQCSVLIPSFGSSSTEDSSASWELRKARLYLYLGKLHRGLVLTVLALLRCANVCLA